MMDSLDVIEQFIDEKVEQVPLDDPAANEEYRRLFDLLQGYNESYKEGGYLYYGRYKIYLYKGQARILFGHHGLYEIDMVHPDSLEKLWEFIND